jgi:hypothetical protein
MRLARVRIKIKRLRGMTLEQRFACRDWLTQMFPEGYWEYQPPHSETIIVESMRFYGETL